MSIQVMAEVKIIFIEKVNKAFKARDDFYQQRSC